MTKYDRAIALAHRVLDNQTIGMTWREGITTLARAVVDTADAVAVVAAIEELKEWGCSMWEGVDEWCVRVEPSTRTYVAPTLLAALHAAVNAKRAKEGADG